MKLSEQKIRSLVREELESVLAERRERVLAVYSGEVVDAIYDVSGPGGKRQVEILFRSGDVITIRGRELQFV